MSQVDFGILKRSHLTSYPCDTPHSCPNRWTLQFYFAFSSVLGALVPGILIRKSGGQKKHLWTVVKACLLTPQCSH